MPPAILLDLAMLAALTPLAWVTLASRGLPEKGRIMVAALVLASVATLVGTAVRIGDSWSTGLADALWATVAACTLLYALLGWKTPGARRLGVLLVPYLIAVGLAALLADAGDDRPLIIRGSEVWVGIHIAGAVTTYALVTLAGIAALAALLQEGALRRKRPTALSRRLPAVAESEGLQTRLLALALGILALDLLSGTAMLYAQQGQWLRIDHKTLLSAASFATIAALLWLQARTGLRGRGAGRLVLAAWLLLTLAYPGVKFVREVLLGG